MMQTLYAVRCHMPIEMRKPIVTKSTLETHPPQCGLLRKVPAGEGWTRKKSSQQVSDNIHRHDDFDVKCYSSVLPCVQRDAFASDRQCIPIFGRPACSGCLLWSGYGRESRYYKRADGSI